MQAIVQTLETRKKALSGSCLCTMIDDYALTAESRLSFTPSMIFFVMGFKDILDEMKVEGSSDPMQLAVNVHCEEDSFHWQWYLKDLERISYGQAFYKQQAADQFTWVWSEELSAVRELVYGSIHLAKQFNTPFYKLVLIEALEGTFECFNEPMFKLVHFMERQEELEYFGQLHAHSEASHAMEKTSEDHESAAYNNYQPTAEEEANALLIINRTFDAFEKAFAVWHNESRDKQVKINIAATA